MTDIFSSMSLIYNLAVAYRYGRGVEKDEDKADKMFAKILSSLEEDAQNGNHDAMWQLGYAYRGETPELVGQDLAKAQYWDERRFAALLKQAENGDVTALPELAHAYRHGYGVEKNLNKAVFWEGLAKDYKPHGRKYFRNG